MISPRREGEGSDVWTVGDLLRWTEGYFRRLGLESARLDAELLLAKALDAARIDLYTQYQKMVEPTERARFRAFVERRARREPVAYITGRREFYGLSFEVTPAVLIPRPETEHLVEAALDEAKRLGAREKPIRVLDLCTGSGNVAVAIAANAASAVVSATDASEAALEVARRNAERLGAAGRVSFHRGDLLDALPCGDPAYDIIVANPPYIPPAARESLMEDVRLHEPAEALFDTRSPSGDGLGFYRAMAAGVRARLEPGGLVAVEVGGWGPAGQAAAVRDLFLAAGHALDRTIKDYGGIERVLAFRA
jgi:release factor glutamine methyltransferase